VHFGSNESKTTYKKSVYQVTMVLLMHIDHELTPKTLLIQQKWVTIYINI